MIGDHGGLLAMAIVQYFAQVVAGDLTSVSGGQAAVIQDEEICLGDAALEFVVASIPSGERKEPVRGICPALLFVKRRRRYGQMQGRKP